MRITESMLKQIILEELQSILEANPTHDKSTGRFKGKPEKGDVYSLTKNALKSSKPSKETPIPHRGVYTGSGKKTTSKFGLNTSGDKSCGRLNIDGTKRAKTHSCSKYPEKYWSQLDEMLSSLTLQEDAIQSPVCQDCIKRFIAAVRRSVLALKGAVDPKAPKTEASKLRPTKSPKSHYRGSKVNPVTRETSNRRAGKRAEKFKAMAGNRFDKTGFSRQELSLINPESLW